MCHSSPCAQARLAARRRSAFQHRRAGATGDGAEGGSGEKPSGVAKNAAAGSLSSTSRADFINYSRGSANVRTTRCRIIKLHSAALPFVFPPFPDRQRAGEGGGKTGINECGGFRTTVSAAQPTSPASGLTSQAAEVDWFLTGRSLT